MRLVIIESPYAGNIKTNLEYLNRCMLHSIQRMESPFASHLIYPQILNDALPEERTLGIECGFAWLAKADLQVFYTDLGWSPGMIEAFKVGRKMHKAFEIRALDGPRRKFPGDAQD